jgi:DNA-binding IclR family transcriptional regulator
VSPTLRAYLEAIEALTAELGRSPSLREIADRVDRSHNAASAACRRLVDDGYLWKDDRGAYHLGDKR